MTNHQAGTIAARQISAQKLDTLVWGLLLVWIGLALLITLGWGIGLLGVGVILLGQQAAKKHLGFQLDTFWVTVGFVFVIGGVSELLGVHISVIPVACIVAGVVLLLAALLERQPN